MTVLKVVPVNVPKVVLVTVLKIIVMKWIPTLVNQTAMIVSVAG